MHAKEPVCTCTFYDSIGLIIFVTEEPKIEIKNIQCNYVEITIADPPFFLKREYEDLIQLRSYTVRCQPQDSASNVDLVDFHPYEVDRSTSSDQPHQLKLDGLIPDRKYKLTVMANYSTVEPTSHTKTFRTKRSGMYLHPVHMIHARHKLS